MENWMSLLPDDKIYILTNIPGTHDSAAYYMNRIGSQFSKTQIHNIIGQLTVGVRNFDFRVTSRGGCNLEKYAKTDDDLIMCHGICDCYVSPKFGNNEKLTFKSILLDIKNFLTKYPTEAVRIDIASGRGKNPELNKRRALELFDKYLGDISIPFNDQLTIGQVRGKVVSLYSKIKEIDTNSFPTYIRTYHATGIDCVHSKYFKYQSFKVNGNVKIREMQEMTQLHNYTFAEAKKLYKKNPKMFPIAYSISCTGEKDNFLPFPEAMAKLVLGFIRQDEFFVKGKYYGWLAMDFADLDVCKMLIETNFYES